MVLILNKHAGPALAQKPFLIFFLVWNLVIVRFIVVDSFSMNIEGEN